MAQFLSATLRRCHSWGNALLLLLLLCAALSAIISPADALREDSASTLFERFDLGGDNFLDSDDLTAMSAVVSPSNPAEFVSSALAFDTSEDGLLSLSEFELFFQSAAYPSPNSSTNNTQSLCPLDCANGGSCVFASDSWSCLCVAGYAGNLCQVAGSPCAASVAAALACANGTCVETNGQPQCVCDTGFSGTACERTACQAGTWSQDGFSPCSAWAVCSSDTQYESSSPSSSADRICTPLRTCSKDEFELVAPTATSDRVCKTLTVCQDDEVEKIPPTPTSDRTCISHLCWDVSCASPLCYSSSVCVQGVCFSGPALPDGSPCGEGFICQAGICVPLPTSPTSTLASPVSPTTTASLGSTLATTRSGAGATTRSTARTTGTTASKSAPQSQPISGSTTITTTTTTTTTTSTSTTTTTSIQCDCPAVGACEIPGVCINGVCYRGPYVKDGTFCMLNNFSPGFCLAGSCVSSNKSPCVNSPCKNGGTCQETFEGEVMCACRDEFRGPTCEIPTVAVNKIGLATNLSLIELPPNTVVNPWADCEWASCRNLYADGTCDKMCNSAACVYDGNDCIETPECKIDSECAERYADGVCNPNCYTHDCGWDAGDCDEQSSNSNSLSGYTFDIGFFASPATLQDDINALERNLSKFLDSVIDVKKVLEWPAEGVRPSNSSYFNYSASLVTFTADNKCERLCFKTGAELVSFINAVVAAGSASRTLGIPSFGAQLSDSPQYPKPKSPRTVLAISLGTCAAVLSFVVLVALVLSSMRAHGSESLRVPSSVKRPHGDAENDDMLDSALIEESGGLIPLQKISKVFPLTDSEHSSDHASSPMSEPQSSRSSSPTSLGFKDSDTFSAIHLSALFGGLHSAPVSTCSPTPTSSQKPVPVAHSSEAVNRSPKAVTRTTTNGLPNVMETELRVSAAAVHPALPPMFSWGSANQLITSPTSDSVVDAQGPLVHRSMEGSKDVSMLEMPLSSSMSGYGAALEGINPDASEGCITQLLSQLSEDEDLLACIQRNGLEPQLPSDSQGSKAQSPKSPRFVSSPSSSHGRPPSSSFQASSPEMETLLEPSPPFHVCSESSPGVPSSPSDSCTSSSSSLSSSSPSLNHRSANPVLTGLEDQPQDSTSFSRLHTKIDITAVDPSGNTPLFYAVSLGRLDAVRTLVQSESCHINAQNKHGETALHWACQSNHAEIAELLLNHGADPKIPTSDGQTPLHEAARKDSSGLVSLLLNHGAIMEAADGLARTPSMVAVQAHASAALKVLLKRGANPNSRDSNGWSLLHWAAAVNDKRMIPLLLQHKADIDAVNGKGESALFVATREENEEAVLALLERFAKRAIEDNSGRTALDLAKARKSENLVRMLQDWTLGSHAKGVVQRKKVVLRESTEGSVKQTADPANLGHAPIEPCGPGAAVQASPHSSAVQLAPSTPAVISPEMIALATTLSSVVQPHQAQDSAAFSVASTAKAASCPPHSTHSTSYPLAHVAKAEITQGSSLSPAGMEHISSYLSGFATSSSDASSPGSSASWDKSEYWDGLGLHGRAVDAENRSRNTSVPPSTMNKSALDTFIQISMDSVASTSSFSA